MYGWANLCRSFCVFVANRFGKVQSCLICIERCVHNNNETLRYGVYLRIYPTEMHEVNALSTSLIGVIQACDKNKHTSITNAHNNKTIKGLCESFIFNSEVILAIITICHYFAHFPRVIRPCSYRKYLAGACLVYWCLPVCTRVRTGESVDKRRFRAGKC